MLHLRGEKERLRTAVKADAPYWGFNDARSKLGLLGVAFALAACGGSGSGSSGGVGPAAPANLTEYPPGTVLALTAHQGLEAATITNGSSVALGALPVLSVQPAPTGSIVLNGATGFAFNMPDGNRVVYNTTAGSTQGIGAQQFKIRSTARAALTSSPR